LLYCVGAFVGLDGFCVGGGCVGLAGVDGLCGGCRRLRGVIGDYRSVVRLVLPRIGTTRDFIRLFSRVFGFVFRKGFGVGISFFEIVVTVSFLDVITEYGNKRRSYDIRLSEVTLRRIF